MVLCVREEKCTNADECVHQLLISIFAERNEILVLEVSYLLCGDQSVERNVLEVGPLVHRQSGRNACDATDKDGEKVVDVVVLGNSHRKHDHLDRTILVLEVHASQRFAGHC